MSYNLQNSAKVAALHIKRRLEVAKD